LKPVDYGSGPDIQGPYEVGMRAMPTQPTLEFGLALPVGLVAMTARRTRPRRVPGIDCHDFDADQTGLVFDEVPELVKRPSRYAGSLLLVKPLPVADALEVFQGDPASGVFSLGDELLAQDMVDITPESSFLPVLTGLGPPYILGPLALPFACSGGLVEPVSPFGVSFSDGIDCGPTVLLAVAVREDIIDPEIDTDEIGSRDRRSFGDIDRHQQEPLAVLPQDQIALSFGPAESLGLILPHEKRDYDPPLERADADPVRPPEANVLAHAIRDGGMLAEPGPDRLVSLVGFTDLSDTPDGHVGW
jgi:hypothetical protein